MIKERRDFFADYRVKLIIIITLFFVISIVGVTNYVKAEEKNNFQKYWPSPSQAKIEFVRSISNAQQLQPKKKKGLFGKFTDFIFGKKEKNIRFKRPFGLSSLGENLYVADPAAQAVYKIDFAEERMEEFLYESEGGFFSGGEGFFATPIDVIAIKDKIFVSDSTQEEVLVFSKEGKLLKKLGSEEMKRPTGLGIARDKQQLYISDTVGNKIYIYDTESYELIDSFANRGGKQGELNYPVDICVRDNKVYVSDSMNFRVQIFDLNGNFISEFGQLGDGSGDFARSKGVAVDSDGNIYVVDALFGVVQIFNEQGKLLLTFGKEGSKPGQFWLPTGIYIDQDDDIYVADSYNHRIQVFKYLGEE